MWMTVKGTPRKAAIFVLLACLGVAGNYFYYPVFYSLDFLFGSIFTVLALQMLGTGPGIAAAAIAGGYTYIIWNHPYAWLILILEAIVLSRLYSRRVYNIVLADALYWVFIGMPLVFLFYYGVMRLQFNNVLITMFKQAINGIFNVLLARLLFVALSFRDKDFKIPMRSLVFNTIILFVITPFLVTIARDSRKDQAELDQRIRAVLKSAGVLIADRINGQLHDQMDKVSYLAGQAATFSIPQMQTTIEHIKGSNDSFLRMGLLDRNATIVAYSPLIDELGQPNLGKNFADRPFIPVLKQKLKPMLGEVVMGRIGVPKPMAPALAPVVINGEYHGYVTGIIDVSHIQRIIADDARSLAIEKLNVVLVDKNNKIIASSNPGHNIMERFSRNKGSMISISDGLAQWLPSLQSNISVSDKWKKAVYVMEISLGKLSEWRLILDIPVEPFQSKLFASYSRKLGELFIVIIIAILAAELISRSLLQPLQMLSEITTGIPAKIVKTEKIVLPGQSIISEANQLIVNFQEMLTALSLRFHEIDSMNISLEGKVRERTNALCENERYLQTIIDASPECIKLLARDGSLLLMNRAGLDMIDAESLEQVQGQRISCFVVDRDRSAFEALTERVFSGESCTLTFEAIGLHGRLICLETHAVPFRNAQGEITASLCLTRDITERQRYETERNQALALLQTVIDTAPVRIFWKNRESCYLGCNSLFAKDAGKDGPDEILGKNDFDMGWAEQAELYRTDDRMVMETGVSRLNFEEPQTTPDGRVIWLRTSKVPLRCSGGEVVGVLGVYDDITGQKEAEQERNAQFDELRRWQEVMLGREERVIQLKTEVNELLARLHEPHRYSSASEGREET